jgi:hypothetical protein
MSLTLLRGAYRLVDARAAPGWDPGGNAVSMFAAGVTVPEAVQSRRELRERDELASVFVATSPDRLYRDLREPRPISRSS